MKYNIKDINNTIHTSFNNDNISMKDIPNIELYVDQIIKIFEDKLSETRRNESEKLLTKSMVNNYSKEKVISQIKGKRYTREQVLQILLIYNLKSTIAIQDIKNVTTRLMDEENGEKNITDVFKEYEANSKYIEALSQMISKQLISKYEDSMSIKDITAMLLSISQVCNSLKKTAETIIDNFYE